MIPVIGVPYIARSDLMVELLKSINRPVQDIVIIDNSYGDTCPKVDDAITIKMHRNAGVSAAWNLIIKSKPKAPWWLIANSDIAFGPKDLEALEGKMEEGYPLVLLESMAAFGISRECIARVGWFDENFLPAYCVVPETPVLTADLRWVPIGEVEVGDELIGVDEHTAIGVQRAMRGAEVTMVKQRLAPCLRVVLEDGREVVCTRDHKWLAKYPARTMAWEWRTAGTLRVGHKLQVGLDTWEPETSFGAGWLAGILDGEGTLHHTDRMTGINIAQKEGAVLDRIKLELEALGIPFTWRVRKPVAGHEPVAVVEISSRRKALELLGRLRPERLMRREIWEGRSLRSRMYPNAVGIAAIEDAGELWVSSVETTARTYIANGITSHNCEDNDYIYRARLLGIKPVFLPSGKRHFGSATLKSLEWARKENDRTYPRNVKYYERKWGGRMHDEVFETPFNEGGSPRDWTLDIERLAELSWVDPA